MAFLFFSIFQRRAAIMCFYSTHITLLNHSSGGPQKQWNAATVKCCITTTTFEITIANVSQRKSWSWDLCTSTTLLWLLLYSLSAAAPSCHITSDHITSYHQAAIWYKATLYFVSHFAFNGKTTKISNNFHSFQLEEKTNLWSFQLEQWSWNDGLEALLSLISIKL